MAFAGLIGMLAGATDPWELPPVRYSETSASGPVGRLETEIREGRRITAMSPLDRLRFVLKLLEIPEESQVLVFSKTSKQNSLIHPGNPRCLFFNENSYVGYVPGGDIEVAAHDPLLGQVFYLVSGGLGEAPMRVERDSSDCLSCHGTARTESVPGVLVRSVFPDASGQPILPLGTYQIDHESPIEERWGGYYVTGRIGKPHLGNRTYAEDAGREAPTPSPELSSVAGKVEPTRYLRSTSDVVALMILEHQCRVQNLITSASMNYRRVSWLEKSLDPTRDPDQGGAGRQADAAAVKIVDALLFAREADPGEGGIEGDPAFQEAFARRFPKSRDGRSLADFQLHTRLFKHRCSFMVYSKAFESMPDRLESAVMAKLREVLTAPPGSGSHPDLRGPERARIMKILAETLPSWNRG